MKRFYFFLLGILFFSCSSNQQKNKEQETNLFQQKAFQYLDEGKTDSAFIFFAKAKDIFLKNKDSLGVASCLINSAIISTDIGDYFGGQELSLNALSYLTSKTKKDSAYLHSNYNNLAIASERLRNYEKAIIFYNLAIKFATDSNAILLYLNNKANAFQGSGHYEEALKIYLKLLKETRKENLAHARILANLAMTKWQLNPNYNALPELRKALRIRQQENDLWGLNSNYDYIANYYIKHNTDSTLHYAKQMFSNAKQLNSADDQLFALQKLIKFSPKPDRDSYFERYLKLDDSLQTARNLAKNRFALIKFETEKHKADNLVLQQQNAEKTYQIIIITTVAVLLLIIGLFWYRKRQQHLKLTAEKAIKENQLKTSKKVHDVVANGLYRVMTEIENEDQLDKERILDKIEDMYEKSRDISYDQVTTGLSNFQETVNSLLKSFKSPTVAIKIKGNNKELWQKVSAKVQYEIEQVLQELMVNMAKHSQATSVSLTFTQKQQKVTIIYEDNGVGLVEGTEFKNGLTNTGNRINNISGSITFDTQTERGLAIHISFPIS